MAPPSILRPAAIAKARKPTCDIEWGMGVDHSDVDHDEEVWWICESEEFWETLSLSESIMFFIEQYGFQVDSYVPFSF